MSEETLDRIKTVDQELSDLLDSVVPTKPMQGIEDYFDLDESTLKEMSPVDLTAISYKLSVYAAHIQKLHNKESAMIHWCDKNMSCLMGNRYPQYTQIRNSPSAIEIEKVRVSSQKRLDAYNLIAGKIELIVKQLSDMAKYKNSESYSR